jgi:Zn-finger nucleic acid-binding protein
MLLCCLKCTSVLDKTRIDEIEVDHCPACGGLWLDHGEIERLSKKMASDIDRLRKILNKHEGPPAVPSDVVATCPACTGEMKEVKLGEIGIDFCSRCKGFFLDRGEIDSALAAVKDSKLTVAQLIATVAAEVPTS